MRVDSNSGALHVAYQVTPHSAVRLGAAMYSFAVLGLFQSSIGVMLPSLSQQYSLGDLHVSLVFIVGAVGYVAAAHSSNLVHCTWGQRGIALLAPTLHILGALAIAAHPPFGLVLIGYAAVALGTGLLDGSWCAWAASTPNANTASGMLQGSFSVGAAVGPFLAGTVMPVWTKLWYHWYFVLVSPGREDHGRTQLMQTPLGRGLCGRTWCLVHRLQI